MKEKRITPRLLVDLATILSVVLLAVFGALSLGLGLAVVVGGGMLALMVPGHRFPSKSEKDPIKR